jgi:hypothetical protein
MTNIKSLLGSFAWAAVATLLLVATFEPAQVDQPALSPIGNAIILA